MNPLSVDWGSFLKMVLGIGSIIGQAKVQERHPLTPWQGIGSGAFVWVQNESDTAQAFAFAAPQVDSAVRIQVVAAHSDALLKSPYSDTRVIVISGRDTATFNMDRPGYYPFARNK